MPVSVREFYHLDLEAIWHIEDKTYEVLYENNVVVPNRKKDLIFNRHCWELFNLFPTTAIFSCCDVNYVLGDEGYTGDIHIKLLESIFKHICLINDINMYSKKDPLLEQVMKVVESINNKIVHRISDYVTTIDAMDFVQLIKDPEIATIQSNLKPNADSIDATHKEISKFMMNSKSKNRFVKAYRSKAINENQANQCIGPRGLISELDRTIFKQPVMNGFIRGMGNLYEITTESRTAAKSLNATDTHIKTSEYASRRIQLLTMSVVGVDVHDCGSTDYMDVHITKNVLENMKGKYYVVPDTGKLDYIRGKEDHLIGTIIKVRTSFGCKSPNPMKICTTCLGKISENFKENSNLGYTMTAYLMEKITQNILSTKHLTHSVKKALIKLDGLANKYFYTDEENNLYFHRDVDLRFKYIVIPNAKVGKLIDVLNLPHTNIALNKVGEFELIGIRDVEHKNPTTESVDISYKDRMSIITKPFLKYIKSIKNDTDPRGNFIIPMEHFDKKQPIFHNPVKETNIVNFVHKIAGMIETNNMKVTDPYEKFNMIFYTIIDQLKYCNMSVIEVIVYATTTYNSYEKNYRLGRNPIHPHCELKSTLFRHRSISQLLVNEDQSQELLTNAPILFSQHNRMPHPMDALFEYIPKQTM